ncbi:MAG: diguanylate cyclase domain-containing protein [Anaeroplasmataceae bacterium]
MNLNEVLALEHVSSSVRQIDMFMSSKKPTSYEYIKALSYKCLVLHSINKTKEALKLLLQATVSFKSYPDEGIVAICDSLIDIFIDLKNSEQAIKYIEIKNEHLPEIDKEQYNYDLIRYFDLVGDRKELKRNIIIYLDNDIPIEKRIYALEKLIKSQYLDYEYDAFYETYNTLESFYLKNFLYDKLCYLRIDKAMALFSEHKYDECKAFIDSYLNEDITNIDAKIKSVCIKINIYLTDKEYRRAMLLEAEYHDDFMNSSLDIAFEFAHVAKRVGEAIGSKALIDDILECIDILNEKVKAIKKEEKKTLKKGININIIENNIHDDSNDVVIDGKETFIESTTDKEPNIIEISNNYKSIEDILSSFVTRENIKFREIFRNYGSAIEKKFSKCEIVIALNKDGIGYHYKKDRVFDKIFSDDDLLDTPLNELITNTSKMYLYNVKDSLFDKNIITKREYDNEFKSIIGFRLIRNYEAIGAIIYEFYTDDFEDKLVYEALRMLTNMLQIHLNNSIDKLETIEEQEMKNFIYDNTPNGIKNEVDHEIEFNERAKEILGISYNSMEAHDFMNLIDYNDAYNYKEVFDNIYNRSIDNATILYHINNKYVKETVMVDRTKVTRIYSIIEDITEEKKKEDILINKAYNDEISKLKNRACLYKDISICLDDKKFSLGIISTANYKMYFDIYGYKFVDDLCFAIGKNLLEIKENYKDLDIYHLENDKFALLFKNTNDSRAILKITRDILDKLSKNLYDINKRLKMNFRGGLFRITKNMSIKDVNKVIWYASEALMDAYEEVDGANIIKLYNDETSKKRYRDSQIVLHISEAIDNNLLKIKYKQMVNIKDNLIEYYYANINLINFSVDEKYLEEVICKRNIKELTDKYLISHVIQEVKTFYSDTNLYYKVMIPLHKSVLLDDNFIPFLTKNLDFFKIPAKIISFYIIDDILTDALLSIKALKQMGILCASPNYDFAIRNNCAIYLCDLKIYSLNLVNILKESCDKLGINMYAIGVDNKDDIKNCLDNNIEVIFGDHYKSLYTLADIIKNSKE